MLMEALLPRLFGIANIGLYERKFEKVIRFENFTFRFFNKKSADLLSYILETLSKEFLKNCGGKIEFIFYCFFFKRVIVP